MSDEQLCVCGLGGVNCTELDSKLDSLDDVMDDFCYAEGFDECFVSSSAGASCVCECGFTGDYCEEEIEFESYNYAVALVLPLLILFCSFWAIRRQKKIIDFTQLDFSTSKKGRVSDSSLLLFRTVILGLGISVFYRTLQRGPRIFAAFTIWNWTMFNLIFLTGFILSLLRYLSKRKYISARRAPNFLLNKIMYLAIEVGLPSAVFIAIVVWTILLPGLKSVGREEAVLNFDSYIFHGANVPILGLEAWISDVHMHWSHAPYLCAWGALYCVFHGVLLVCQALLDTRICPVYPILSPSSPFLAAWIFGLLFLLFASMAFTYIFLGRKRRITDDAASVLK